MARILDQLVGHQAVVNRLLSAVDRNRLAQTLIFSGPSGVGKKKVAIGLTQVLVCDGKNGCGNCGPCLRVANLQSEDLLFIEPEGAQIKIEQAKQIRQFVSLQKMGKSRTIIINEAQSMNSATANSLLKTFEEPPENTYFILLVRSLSSLLPTIRSRAQVLNFSGLSASELQQIKSYEPWVVAACGGSVEQADYLSGEGWADVRTSAMRLVELAISKSAWQAVEEVRELIKDRDTALFVTSTYQKWLRDILHCRLGGSRCLTGDQGSILKISERFSTDRLSSLWQMQLQMEKDINGNVDKNLVFENFFLELAAAVA